MSIGAHIALELFLMLKLDPSEEIGACNGVRSHQAHETDMMQEKFDCLQVIQM